MRLILLISFISCTLYANEVAAKTSDYEAAVQAYNKHDIETAFIHLQNALKENKKNLPAKLLLAEVLIKKHLYTAAEQELNDAVSQGADVNLIINPLGRALLYQGKFTSVLALDEQKKLHKQGKLAFNLIKAKAHLALLDTDAAENLYQTILLQYPNNEEATLELAAIYNTKNSLVKSQELLNKVALVASENSRLWQVKGQLASKQGQPEIAIAYLEKANTLEPDNADILRNMASSYIELQRPDKAQALIEQVLVLMPNDLQAQLMKSKVLKMLGKKQLSDEVLMALSNQLSSIDESYMLSHPQLILVDAMSSYGQEQWLQAQKKFQMYINQGVESNDMSAVVLLADVYIKLGKADAALKLLSHYEAQLLKNKNYALILAGLYLEFNKNFKADYILKRLQQSYPNDEAVLILSAKVLSRTGQDEKASQLLESTTEDKGANYTHSLAVAALRAGEYDKTLEHIHTLITTFPEVIEYRLLHVHVLLELKQFNDAKNIILELYEKHPNNYQVRFRYAQLQFNLDNLTTAKAMLTELVKENPEDGESWFVLAQIEYDLKNIEAAISILERQTKNSEYRVKALHKLALVHYAQQAFEKSLVVINVLLQKNRLDTQAILVKAKNLIALEKIDEAKHQLDILLGLWGRDARNLLKLSKLQLRVDDVVGAEKSLETAYSLKPQALPIIIEIVKVKIKLNKLTEASTILAKGEGGEYKDNHYLIILKGDIELAKGDVNAAFNYYLTVLDNDDANVVALMKLSQVSQTKALSDKFIEKLTYLVKKHPENTLQRHTFADHLFAHQKLAQAKFQYQLLITQKIPVSKRAMALNNLAIIYLTESAFKAGVEASTQAYKMLPSPTITDTLGWSLVLSGEAEQGLSYLRQAFTMSSAQPEIQYHIAYALVKLDRTEEAKPLLRQVIKHPDSFAEHQLAKELLTSLE